MAKKFDDGGSIYPSEYSGLDHTGRARPIRCLGMTLLDYYAGQAMASGTELTADMVAKWSYARAESMIAEKRRRESME